MVAEVTAQVEKELALGWLTTSRPHPEAERLMNAPIFAKQEPGKVRRLTDYSAKDENGVKRGVNGIVDASALGDAPMHRPLDLARAVHRHTSDTAPPLMLVRDLSKAFRRIGVRRVDVAALHTIWNGQHIWDTRLPFGHAASAHYCCKLSGAVAQALTRRSQGQATVLAYVDDFVIISTPDYAQQAEADFCECMADLGLTITAAKAEQAGSWSTKATWIGYLHDAVERTHSLPPGKLEELQQLLTEAITKGAWQRSKLQTLLGKLNFVANVHTIGRAYMRNLYTAVNQLTPWIVLERAAVEDLRWWHDHLPKMREKACMRRKPSVDTDWCIATDASLTGTGYALYDTRKAAKLMHEPFMALAQPFASRAEPRQMMELEALAVKQAFDTWAPILAGRTIWVQLDNLGLVYALRSGRSHSPTSNAVIQHIMGVAVEHDIQFFTYHVHSQENSHADALSRLWERSKPTQTQLPQMYWTTAAELRHSSHLWTQAETKPCCDTGWNLRTRQDSVGEGSLTPRKTTYNFSSGGCNSATRWEAPAYQRTSMHCREL